MLSSLLAVAQEETLSELGANFNHNPEIIDMELLDKTGVRWVRTTPYLYEYLEGTRNPQTDEGLQKLVDAKKAGYRVLFGFRIDFKSHNERIPEPGSAREKEIFDMMGSVLARLGGSTVDIFTLGNEPNLETMSQDLKYQDSFNGVPLVVFTERILSQVIEPLYSRNGYYRPKVYAGSFPAIFESTWMNNEGVKALLQFANDDDRVEGFDLHFHISSFDEVETGFQFARSIMPEKPFIITEFSLHRLYRAHISEILGANDLGVEWANEYGYDPNWETYRWYTVVNSNRVTPEELGSFFDTRDWYIPHYLNQFQEKFDEYGVKVATYPILQQSAPQVLNEASPLWFLNPVFMQVSLEVEADGSPGENPLCAQDYYTWAAYRIPLGILDQLEDTILLYPNPSKGLITLSRGSIQGDILVRVIDMNGKYLREYLSKKDEIKLDLRQLKEGIYIVELTTQKGIISKRIIISNNQ